MRVLRIDQIAIGAKVRLNDDGRIFTGRVVRLERDIIGDWAYLSLAKKVGLYKSPLETVSIIGGENGKKDCKKEDINVSKASFESEEESLGSKARFESEEEINGGKAVGEETNVSKAVEEEINGSKAVEEETNASFECFQSAQEAKEE